MKSSLQSRYSKRNSKLKRIKNLKNQKRLKLSQQALMLIKPKRVLQKKQMTQILQKRLIKVKKKQVETQIKPLPSRQLMTKKMKKRYHQNLKIRYQIQQRIRRTNLTPRLQIKLKIRVHLNLQIRIKQRRMKNQQRRLMIRSMLPRLQMTNLKMIKIKKRSDIENQNYD